MNEIDETIRYYQTNPESLSELNEEEILILKGNLQERFQEVFKSTSLLPSKIKIKKNKAKAQRKYIKLGRILTLETRKPLITRETILATNLSQFQSDDFMVIDHKIPLCVGFKNNVPCEILCHIDNLRVVSAKTNMIKGITILVDETNQWIWDKHFSK